MTHYMVHVALTLSVRVTLCLLSLNLPLKASSTLIRDF